MSQYSDELGEWWTEFPGSDRAPGGDASQVALSLPGNSVHHSPSSSEY